MTLEQKLVLPKFSTDTERHQSKQFSALPLLHTLHTYTTPTLGSAPTVLHIAAETSVSCPWERLLCVSLPPSDSDTI